MNWELLLQKKEQLDQIRNTLPKEALESFDRSFDIEYAHNSTAIEGNTLTLIQTKAILEDGLSVGGKTIREIYEVANHAKAFTYVKKRIAEGISGGFRPPSPNEMYRQIKDFFADLPYRTDSNAVELAAWTHAEFVKIHPFVDGNGRTSRMLMNYQLMAQGFLPVSIAKEDRLEYFDALEAYAVSGNLIPFTDLIAALEEVRLDEYLSIG